MIWYYLVSFITHTLSFSFSFLPTVSSLPTVLGVDTDYYLSSAVGYAHSFIKAIWPLQDLLVAALFYAAYLIVKNIVIRLFLGNRAPQ